MRLSIDQWWPLLFLLPMAAVMVWTYRTNQPHTKRFKQLIGLRSAVFVMLVLALCQVNLIHKAEKDATYFLIDASDSMKFNRQEAETFVREAAAYVGEDDVAGVIAFGSDAVLQERLDGTLNFDTVQVSVDGAFTNLQQALLKTQVLFPSDHRKRLVLLTDGMENVGSGAKQLKAMKGSGIDIDVVDLTAAESGEVQVAEIDLPEYAQMDQVIEISVKVKSNIKTDGNIYVYKNGDLLLNEAMAFEQGDNAYVFTDTVTEGGISGYSVEVTAGQDSYSENNRLSAFTTVNDMPKVLVVQDGDGQGENFDAILAGVCRVEIREAGAVPVEAASLLGYDAYVLADVPYDSLPEIFLQQLQIMVRDQGKGLLVTGGDSSYGMGGYFDTTLEEMLPVTMEAKSKEEKPNLGIVLVIDKSGSMSSGQYGVTKMELAKEAAIRSTEILDEKDYLGVLAFDGEGKWVVEPAKVTDAEAMRASIGTLRPGGGTTIRPSLEAAVDALIPLETGLKHIILLTDGQAENTGYEGVLKRMNEGGITLSTLAVGQEADRYLLHGLAEAGGGRYYETDVFTDIPSIFTKEAYLAGKKYMNDVTFYPQGGDYDRLLTGLNDVASLDGYVAVSPKDNAQLVLTGPDEDPVMAVWQYGLGRTMAWTSDMNGLWTGAWLNWEGNRHLWINAFSWLAQVHVNEAYTVTTKYSEGVATIRAEHHGTSADVLAIEGTVTSPEGEITEVALKATAPGIYESDFDPEGEGLYLVNLEVTGSGEEERVVTAVNVGYSPEFDRFSHQGLTPVSIAGLSGGRLLTEPSEVFETTPPDVSGSRDLTNKLYLIALLLFLLELVVRKTVFMLPDIAWVKGISRHMRFSRKIRSKATQSYDTAYLDELTKNK